MVRKFAAILALVLIVSAAVVCAEAQEETVVYVTIASAGELALPLGEVAVTDTDGDGVLTVSDALYLAHEAYYEGGTQAGYACEAGDYGLCAVMLWGVENGGSYGYYVNDTAAENLAVPIVNGDHISAFSYADLENWSDIYAYFSADYAVVSAGGTLSLTLMGVAWDENWAPVVVALAGAEIVVNGEATGCFTDDTGTAELTFADAGEYIVSAVASDATLVPPVCAVIAE